MHKMFNLNQLQLYTNSIWISNLFSNKPTLPLQISRKTTWCFPCATTRSHYPDCRRQRDSQKTKSNGCIEASSRNAQQVLLEKKSSRIFIRNSFPSEVRWEFSFNKFTLRAARCPSMASHNGMTLPNGLTSFHVANVDSPVGHHKRHSPSHF